MAREFARKNLPVRPLAVILILTLTLGIVCGGAKRALADDLDVMEPAAENTIIGIEAKGTSSTNITEPKANATPDETAYAAFTYEGDSSDGASCSLSWLEDGTSMSAATFTVDHAYTAEAVRHITGGLYELATDATVTLNGRVATPIFKVVEADYSIGASYTWTLREVTYDSNGGEGNMDSHEFYQEEGVTLKANKFTREGHVFAGWNTQADGKGDSYADEQEVADPTSSLHLYAQWTPITYKCTKGDGQTWTKGSSATADLTFERSSDASSTFGHFTGISVDGKSLTKSQDYDATSGSVVAKIKSSFLQNLSTGEHTVTASFDDGSATAQLKVADKEPETKTYTITFDANGGKGTMDDLPVKEGDSATLPANGFTHDGYTFVSWNTAKDGSGTSYNAGDKVTPKANMTLYAQWKENEPVIELETPAPEVNTSAGGKLISRDDYVTFTITQKIPSDVTSLTINFDLDPAMEYVSSFKDLMKEADVAATATLDGQKLSVTLNDAQSFVEKYGDTAELTFVAKVRSDADLTPYLSESGKMALIPYSATTDFKGLEDRSASSKTEELKVAIGGSSSSGSGTTTTKSSGTTTKSSGTTTKSSGTTTKSSTTPKTADATSLSAIATTALCGVGLAIAGFRKRD